MPQTLLIALTASGGAAALTWLLTLLDPARAWTLQPIGEDGEPARSPAAWPTVAIVVPARNEAAVLPETLPSLLAQDYPGRWRIVLVDDRSEDGTAEAAGLAAAQARSGERLDVVRGQALPDGWVGKVWALEQGVRAAGNPDYLLLTDADIRHAPGSLVSRMALLRCVSAAERLPIPAFVLFFNLLYPMRRVNDLRSRVAAAAGGCVLLRRAALERAGGLEAIRGEIIDDVSLARAVARSGGALRLAVSRSDVVSLREYGSVTAVGRMVRRTAFVQLRRSWLLLALTLLLLALLFPLSIAPAWVVGAASAGLAAWALQTAVSLRTVRHFGLPDAWAWTLPLAGTLYGGMTLDSGLRDLLGGRGLPSGSRPQRPGNTECSFGRPGAIAGCSRAHRRSASLADDRAIHRSLAKDR